jgi:hypothetical protein
MSRQPNQSVYRPIAGTGQNITTSGTAANNATAFGVNTSIIRISATEAIRYRIGPAAVAVATDTYLPSGAVEYVGVVAGDRLSVLQDSAAGSVNVTECTR